MTVGARFLSRAPVWDPLNVGGQYTFVGNRPMGVDPLGLLGELVEAAAQGYGDAWAQARQGHLGSALGTYLLTNLDVLSRIAPAINPLAIR